MYSLNDVTIKLYSFLNELDNRARGISGNGLWSVADVQTRIRICLQSSIFSFKKEYNTLLLL